MSEWRRVDGRMDDGGMDCLSASLGIFKKFQVNNFHLIFLIDNCQTSVLNHYTQRRRSSFRVLRELGSREVNRC